MNVKEALGLGPANGRSTVVPMRIWLPVAVVLMVVGVAALRIIGVAPAPAILVGAAVGAVLAIPLSALILRGSRRLG